MSPSITGLVPYTGATTNVNLGIYTITATSLIKSGGLPTQFLKADGSVDTNSYVTMGTVQTITGIKTFTDTISITNGSNINFNISGTPTGSIIVNSTYFQLGSNNSAGFVFKNIATTLNPLTISNVGNAVFLGSVTATGFTKTGDSNANILLAGGGTTPLNLYVTLANSQTITGYKTFTDNITLYGTGGSNFYFTSSLGFGGEILVNTSTFQFRSRSGYTFLTNCLNSAASGNSALLLNTSGAATFFSSVTATGFFNSSDSGLKNITERDGDTVRFTWKDKRDDKVHIGYIAQEVQDKYPDQVSKGSDGLLTVNYIEVLVAKIQELENRIKQLEK